MLLFTPKRRAGQGAAVSSADVEAAKAQAAEAASKAAAADTKAASASTEATAAQTQADDARRVAGGAMGRANTASSTANEAKATASAAETSAADAKGTAADAKSIAGTASSDAAAAKAKADQANSTAASAASDAAKALTQAAAVAEVLGRVKVSKLLGTVSISLGGAVLIAAGDYSTEKTLDGVVAGEALWWDQTAPAPVGFIVKSVAASAVGKVSVTLQTVAIAVGSTKTTTLRVYGLRAP